LLAATFGAPRAAKRVDRAVLRRRHQPTPRVIGDPVSTPAVERFDEGVLRYLLGQRHAAQQAHEHGDQLR
jgi:hypothetical protein